MFACERVLETEHKLHILTSTTYDRHVVSFLFSWCSTGGLGLTLLDAGFLYGILSASSLDPKLHRGFPRTPSVGCGFPYHIWSLEVFWQLLWHPTQLNYIIIQRPHDRPLDLWNRMFNRHQAETTVMQFRGHSLPVHHCSGTMGPSPCPIS